MLLSNGTLYHAAQPLSLPAGNIGLMPTLLRVLPFWGEGRGVFPWLKQTASSKTPSSWRCSPHPIPDQHGVGRSCHNLKLLWQSTELQHSHWQMRILPLNHAHTDGNGHAELHLGSAEAGVGLPHNSFSFCSVLLLPLSFQSCSFQEVPLINALYANLHLSLGNLTYEKPLINPKEWMTLKTFHIEWKKKTDTKEYILQDSIDKSSRTSQTKGWWKKSKQCLPLGRDWLGGAMKIFLVCEDGNMLYLDSGMGCMDVCNCQNSLNVLLKLYIWGHVNYAPIKKNFFFK